MAPANRQRVVGLRRDRRLAPLHPGAHHAGAAPTKSADVNRPPRSSPDVSDDAAEIATAKSTGDATSPAQTRKRAADVAAREENLNLMSTKHVLKTTYSRGKSKLAGQNVPKKKSQSEPSKPENATEDSSKRSKGARRASFKPPAEVAKATFRPPPSVEAPSRPKLNVPPAIERPRAVFRVPSAPELLAPDLPSADRDVVSTVSQSPSVSTVIASSGSYELPPSSSTTIDPLADDISSSAPEPLLDQCPICKTTVSPESLSELRRSLSAAQAHNRSRFNQQAAFCRSHREASGRDEWKRRGYPVIDWSELPARLEAYRSEMIAILQGTRSSIYQDELREMLATRRANGEHVRETLAKEFLRDGDSAETVGYYGGRGAGIMMNWLVKSLAKPLRKMQKRENSMIQACGSLSAYVQRVLVPELATLLVVEDMRTAAADERGSPPVKKLKRKKDALKLRDNGDAFESPSPPGHTSAHARERLKDSADLGRLLCQEVDDEIIGEDGEEELINDNDPWEEQSQPSDEEENDDCDADERGLEEYDVSAAE